MTAAASSQLTLLITSALTVLFATSDAAAKYGLQLVALGKADGMVIFDDIEPGVTTVRVVMAEPYEHRRAEVDALIRGAAERDGRHVLTGDDAVARLARRGAA